MSRPFSPRIVATSLAAATLLQACGGGGSDSATTASATTTAAYVRVEGCVVDRFYVPDEGVPVRVLAADGRTLAYATSGRSGEFVAQVPLGTQAALAIDRPGGEWLPAPVLDRDRVVEMCLVTRN